MITERLLEEHNYKKTAGIRRDESEYCTGSWMKWFSDFKGNPLFALQFDVWEFSSDEEIRFTFYTCIRNEVVVLNISSPLFVYSIEEVEDSAMRIWTCLNPNYHEQHEE